MEKYESEDKKIEEEEKENWCKQGEKRTCQRKEHERIYYGKEMTGKDMSQNEN